jgi:NAD(P)-dependent dehydrogenase (short-subunit alcohol dehydrogenase family)
METRVALVTGTSSGIGRAIAELMAREGYRTFGTVRQLANATAPPGVQLVGLDVTDDNSVASCVTSVLAAAGRIDVLVNNAGMVLYGAVEEIELHQARAIFETNFFGVLRMTDTVLPIMRRQGCGRIINISSIGGYVPMPFEALYCATKHALEGLTESLDHEVRPLGIRAIVVEPGYIRSEISRKSSRANARLEVYERYRQPATRQAALRVDSGDSPESVARVVLRAATAQHPHLLYVAGRGASRLRFLRWFMPARLFDSGLRRHFKLPG